ncbi:protein UXT isoform X2 [Falco cherrug]|uniref:protein UXT isoform X2 n=1 Tax=Falco cherrug TaxID=345164 RepID=UPI00247AC33B|nr:protein UXT isoform X2 [Falco cherrug]
MTSARQWQRQRRRSATRPSSATCCAETSGGCRSSGMASSSSRPRCCSCAPPLPASRRQLLRCTPRSTSAATSSSPQKYGPCNPLCPLSPSPQRVFVALGYGFFAELTLPEALRHLDRRSRLLDRLSESLTRDGAKIRAHIRLVLEGLRELQGLQDPPTTSDP